VNFCHRGKEREENPTNCRNQSGRKGQFTKPPFLLKKYREDIAAWGGNQDWRLEKTYDEGLNFSHLKVKKRLEFQCLGGLQDT